MSSQAAGSASRAPRIGFLFNHEHLHQIAHSAPIAFELGRARPELSITLLASDARQLDYLRQLAQAYPGARLEFCLLSLNPLLAPLRRGLDKLLPFTRLMTLWAHRTTFGALDVLVVPEKTSLILRRRFGLKNLKFVHTRHGAGDREVGFDRSSGEFDLVLMSGAKIRDRLREAGLLKEDGYAIVGYAKFDLHATGPLPKLFDNDRPTVIYNPHFSPRLSSWYAQGMAVLEAFAQSDRYNLIFAPHVMLFQKQVQVSIDKLRLQQLLLCQLLLLLLPRLHLLQHLLQLGADAVHNYKTDPDWDTWAVKKTGGLGVDKVIEIGGAETLNRSLKATRFGGHIALIGVLTGTSAEVQTVQILRKGIRLDGIYVGSREMFAQMLAEMERVKLQPVIDSTFEFRDAPAAFQRIASGKHFGKIVIRV